MNLGLTLLVFCHNILDIIKSLVTCAKHGAAGDVPQDCMHMVNRFYGDNSLCSARVSNNSGECTVGNQCSCSEYWYNYNRITSHLYPAPKNCTGANDTSAINYIAAAPIKGGWNVYESQLAQVEIHIMNLQTVLLLQIVHHCHLHFHQHMLLRMYHHLNMT